MQRRPEDRALDIEAEISTDQEVTEDLGDLHALPKSPEQQRTTDPPDGDFSGINIGQDQATFIMTRK
ncbi:hypothetical protein GLI01_16590 [Gluconacetobacter liquefaciens]|uniref:Uncharacterized protein n=1 Tax=Gluconacetobacter liquefaciens TaxID=89584 RepID=A0A370G7K0_GLULI|nr:hypothetical protein [Gluconacetobacter liquefaciens]MBB2185963.1 hypothetical protein [Gluconacetobacter liquefaciens]RDI39781.1 hypothetical protein C7453_102577 [Gluconacetobacter liquefaciens]GEB37624.1 hypothetical protein GLI01_16590 [Gluconacetobacter liquefaciens]